MALHTYFSDGEFITIFIPDGDSKAGTLRLPASGVPMWPAEKTQFVGKHGSNANNGLNPLYPKQTISAAVEALSSSGGSVVVIDGGHYEENITVPTNMHINAAGATLVGTGSGPAITLGSGCEVTLLNLIAAYGEGGVFKQNTLGLSTINVNKTYCSGSGGYGFVNVGTGGGTLYVNCATLYVGENSVGVGDISTNTGHVHVNLEDVYLTGSNAIGLSRVGNGSTVGHVTHILETDTGVGSGRALNVLGGRINIHMGIINCNEAYNVGGAGELNMFALEITGSTGGAGTVNVTTP